MRVSFLGKGGSGKTSLSSSFIKFLVENGKTVLAVDADINVNLGTCLGIDTKFIGDSFDEISNFLEPQNYKRQKGFLKTLIQNFKSNTCSVKPIIGTTPPTKESHFIKPDLHDEFFQKFATFKGDNFALLTVGTYTDKKVGYACYHSKLGSAVLIYNRLLDNNDFFVVSDATAGIDSVGTSMFFVSDINIFVVEPTNKSIGVYKDFKEITKNYPIKTFAIGNKIRNDEDINFIKSGVGIENIIGFVSDSEYLREYEKGDKTGIDKFVNENKQINEKIYDLLLNTPKAWDKYYSILKQVYIDDCGDWYSQYYGEDLTKYIDENFNYLEIIKDYV